MTTLPAPSTLGARLRSGLPLLGAAVAVNLLLLAVGTVAGAAMTVDNAGTTMGAGAVEVVLASLFPLGLALVVHSLLVPRVDVVGRIWTPVVAVLALLSLGALTGAADLTTALVLGTMHLVVGALAAVGIPRRLGR